MQVIWDYETIEDYVEDDFDRLIWEYGDLNIKYNLLMSKYIELEKTITQELNHTKIHNLTDQFDIQ